MKKIIGFLMAVVVATLIGCSGKQLDYAVDVAMINNDLSIIQDRYSMLTTIAENKWDKLTPEEQADLKLIDGNVQLIFSKVNQLKSTQAYNITLADIGYLYTLAKDSYIMAKEIVTTHKADLTRSEMMTLSMFDQQLQSVDIRVKELMNDPENADINMTLTTILAVGGMAMKVLVPLVVAL